MMEETGDRPDFEAAMAQLERIVDTAAGRTDDGRPHGVPNRSQTGFLLIILMMSRCGSPTKPSTKRCMCKVVARYAVNWSPAYVPGERCACRGFVPVDAARSSSAPSS